MAGGARFSGDPVRGSGQQEGRWGFGLVATHRKASSSLRAPSARVLEVAGTWAAWPHALRADVVCVPTTVRSAVLEIRCLEVRRGWVVRGIGHASVRRQRGGSEFGSLR